MYKVANLYYTDNMNKEKYMRIDRHHLLEIILWPNGDGTFRKIINSAKRLKELGIYYDWKLTITVPASEHAYLHANNRSDATKRKMSAAKKGENNPMYGTLHSEEAKSKKSAAMKGNTYAKGKRSEEAKAKMSAAQIGNTNVRGRRWYNNGITSIRAIKCPPGFTSGRIYKRKRVEK